jgi:hypothetical protein
MKKCKFCPLEANFKLRDLDSKEIYCVCNFCEPKGKFELIEEFGIKSLDPKKPLENIESLDKVFGRLHFVRKPKKSFLCYVCNKTIEIGEKSFTRSLREGKMYFPIQKRCCFSCSKKLINEGTIYVGISEEDLEKS